MTPLGERVEVGAMDKTNVIIAPASPAHPRNSEASMVELKDGAILLGYQEFLSGPAGGHDEGHTQLVTVVSRDGGLTWGDKRVRVTNNPGDVNVYNSNFLRLPDGEILYVFMRYNQLARGKPQLMSLYACRSNDEGATFSQPWPMWEREPVGCASGVLKLLKSGRIILPTNRQTGEVWSPTDHVVLGAAWSDDGGRTWRKSTGTIDLPMRGAMEGHVEELRDGRIMMVMRTQLGSVFQSFSVDGGDTWSKPQTTVLRQPETCPELRWLITGRFASGQRSGMCWRSCCCWSSFSPVRRCMARAGGSAGPGSEFNRRK